MSNYLLGFPNKKERDDFLIAIVVILLFIWLFWYMMMGREKPNLNMVPPVAEVVAEPDTDNDGILDINDKCPNLAGIIANKGCPSDEDNDGIYDMDDKCPKLAGVRANNGCPADSDGDGVYDVNDKCPNERGKASENGCPPLSQSDLSFFDDLRESVQFRTGSAKLDSKSIDDMNRLADILLLKSSVNLKIEGHTDSTGSKDRNQLLSEQRANACRAFLINRGIDGARLISKGFGSTRPIPGTKGDEPENKRVVFEPF